MTEQTWLIDKSALVRLAASPDAEEWAERIGRGLVHITTVTLLEVGFSARSGRDHAAVLESRPIAAMPVVYSSPRIEDRAVQVQRALARRGQHRTPSIPDLLVAAAAELDRHTVLHLDKDFELIARYTDQPLERITEGP